MFPTRYFPDRYFAPRYFPKVGAAPPVSAADSSESVHHFAYLYGRVTAALLLWSSHG